MSTHNGPVLLVLLVASGAAAAAGSPVEEVDSAPVTRELSDENNGEKMVKHPECGTSDRCGSVQHCTA
jgi:hypothetical protein